MHFQYLEPSKFNVIRYILLMLADEMKFSHIWSILANKGVRPTGPLNRKYVFIFISSNLNYEWLNGFMIMEVIWQELQESFFSIENK